MGNGNDKHSHQKNGDLHTKQTKESSTFLDPDLDKLFKSEKFNQASLEMSVFQEYFWNCRLISKILVKNCQTNNQQGSSQLFDAQKTQFIFNQLINANDNNSIIDTYLNLIFHDDQISDSDVLELLKSCFLSFLKCAGVKNQNEFTIYSISTLEGIVQSIQFVVSDESKKTITRSQFKYWVLNEFPLLFYGVHNFFLKKVKFINDLNEEESNLNDLTHLMNSALVWYLVCTLPNCYLKNLASENGSVIEKFKNCIIDKRWRMLYSSESHGLSLNRFQNSLFNYKAPTVLLIYCQSGNLFCVCNNEEYKESPTAYGDSQVRVYRLWKTFKEYEVSSSNNIYMNTRARSLTIGLIIGYSQLRPYLKIDEHFQSVEHELCKNDLIVSVEAWGCGSSKEALHQTDMKKWEAKQIEKMRTSKRNPVDWAENEDRAILDFGGIKVEHSERGDM